MTDFDLEPKLRCCAFTRENCLPVEQKRVDEYVGLFIALEGGDSGKQEYWRQVYSDLIVDVG